MKSQLIKYSVKAGFLTENDFNEEAAQYIGIGLEVRNDKHEYIVAFYDTQ